MRDSIVWVFLLLGLVLLLPPLLPAASLLHLFGRTSGMEFASDESGRLAAGPQAEAVLAGLVWRPSRAVGCLVASLAATTLLMRHGPGLSQSNLKSAVVALVACAGVLGPYLVLRQFLHPFSGQQTGYERAAISVEDYLGTARRVVTWLVAASALAVPVGALLLSPTAAYDGYKIYWEGLVGVPLVSAGVVLAAELAARGVRDRVTDPGLVYLWDVLRARSLRLITAVAAFGAALSYEMASGGLNGVAHVQPFPATPTLLGVTVVMAGLLKLTALVLLLAPVGRFRGRLWPGLGPGERIRWGAATQGAPAS